MALHEITIDPKASLADTPATGHNRWHPDIPPMLTCHSGDTVSIQCRDGYDRQFTRDSTAEDVAAADQNRIHPLTGPVYVEGAEPGDLLVVDILAVQTGHLGWTLQFPGFGFLRDEFTEPHIVRWDIDDSHATSPDLPGVRVPGAPFMGVIGVAPSYDLLAQVSAQEDDLARRGGLVLRPDPQSAVPGEPGIATTAARTISPTEAGGNVDIKQLTAGTRVLLPVWVPGALFSVGDGHFAQGDGEACGAAIETDATVTVRFGLRKRAAAEQQIRFLRFERRQTGAAVDTTSRPHYAVTGLPIDGDGTYHGEDLGLATKNALRTMVSHLVTERCLTRQQAYALCSVAVDVRISQLVDVPNVIATAFLPTDIFV